MMSVLQPSTFRFQMISYREVGLGRNIAAAHSLIDQLQHCCFLNFHQWDFHTSTSLHEPENLLENRWVVGGYRYTFNGQEQENELNPSITSAEYWMYDGRLGRRWNVDPVDQVNVSNYAVMTNNPIFFIDKIGLSVDASELIKSDDHAKAFKEFASTKQGKKFLDNYAGKGQKIEYNGETLYEAQKDGKYHLKNVDLIYKVGQSEGGSSTSGKIILGKKEADDRYQVILNIPKKGFGSNSRTFNLAKAIVHESFHHANFLAEDFIDNGLHDQSNIPEMFRRYDDHADHYYVAYEYIKGTTDENVLLFPVSGYDVLSQVAKNLGIKLSQLEIRTIMWNYTGSLIIVNPTTGKLEYKVK